MFYNVLVLHLFSKRSRNLRFGIVIAGNRGFVEERIVKLTVIGLVLLLLLAPAAFADFSVELGFEFTGGASPVGPAPWVTANFVSLVGGGMQLTIDTSGLTPSEFLSEFLFNFNTALEASSFVPVATTLGTHDDVKSIAAKNDKQSSGGGHKFDYEIKFPTAKGSRFEADETFVLRVGEGIAGITAETFQFATTAGFYAAAHIQGIGAREDSGWIGSSTVSSPIPEPGSILLVSTILASVGVLMRRRSAARRG
jgi:hypothetical protein